MSEDYSFSKMMEDFANYQRDLERKGKFGYQFKRLGELAKALGPVKDFEGLELFFGLALKFYTDPTEPGMDTQVGHMIYRLSDSVPQDIRKKIAIYPNEEGLIVEQGVHWTSLEDFRTEWEGRYSHIPEFIKYPKLTDLSKSPDTSSL